MSNFVTYNLAVLAKEKGFNEPSLAYYTYNEKLCRAGSTSNNVDIQTDIHSDIFHTYSLAPLYDELVDWFWDKHEILITPTLSVETKKWGYELFQWQEWVDEKGYSKYEDLSEFIYDKKYEAIKIALEKAFKLI